MAESHSRDSRLTGRTPAISVLRLALILSSAILALTPIVARILLKTSTSALHEGDLVPLLASLIAVALLLMAPLIVLGSVPTFVARLWYSRVLRQDSPESLGTTYGKISAIGTVGSIFGTLVSSLVLLPALGVSRTLASLGLLLILVATAHWHLLARAALASPFLILLTLAPRTLTSGVSSSSTIAAKESPYALVQVIADEHGRRDLVFDEGFATQSVLMPGQLRQGEIWDHYLLAPWLTANPPDAPRILLLGLGAGTAARSLRSLHPNSEIVGVELDPVVVELARAELQLPADIEVHIGDARVYLGEDERAYDIIIVDAFRFPYVPFHLVTVEFFQMLQRHLRSGGVVVMNLGRWDDDKSLVTPSAASMRAVFASVSLVDARTRSNTLIYAAQGSVDFAKRLRLRTPMIPPDLRSFASRVARELSEVAAGSGEPFTDDHAPVEHLTDLILLRSIPSLWRSL